MKRFALLLALLAGAIQAFGSANASGKLTNPDTSGAVPGYAQFTLYNCGGNFPQVAGSSILSTQQFPLNADGTWSGIIDRNDEITCNGTASTWWRLQYFVSGRQIGPSRDFVCSQASCVFDGAGGLTPITTYPAPPAPAQPLTGAESVVCSFPTPASTWSCTENMGTQQVVAEFFDLNSKQILPDTAQATDVNTFVGTFLQPQAGFMRVVNVGNWTPSVSFPNYIIGNPTSDQSIAGDHALSLGGSLSAKRIEAVRSADQFASANAALTDIPSAGGELFFSPDTTFSITCGSTQIAPGATKVLHLVGSGITSAISGSACPLITFAANNSSLNDLYVTDPTGNAASVGIDVENGTTGVIEWDFKNPQIVGTGSVSGSIGLKTNFGLIGNVLGGHIQGWDVGAQLSGPDATHRSNAVHFGGTTINGNNTGISYPSGVDDAFIDSSVIESNVTAGIDFEGTTGGKLSISNSHFENAGAANIKLGNSGGGNVSSVGNGFYAGTSGRDFYITGGNWNVHSFADTLNEGVTNNGTGSVTLFDPIALGPVSGTGNIYEITGFQIQQLNPVGNSSFTLNGYAFFEDDQANKLKEVGTPGCVAAFDWFWGDSTAHRLKMCNNNGSPDVVVGAATTDTLTNKTLTSPVINSGTIQGTTYSTTTNCAVNSASPAACGSAASGAFVVPTTTTSYTVSTTAVTSHSRIFLQPITFASDLPSTPTCVAPASGAITISAISAGTSFTFALPSTTGTACFMYEVVN